MAKIDAYYDYANDVEQVDILNGDQVDRVKDGCDGSENESKEEEDVDTPSLPYCANDIEVIGNRNKKVTEEWLWSLFKESKNKIDMYKKKEHMMRRRMQPMLSMAFHGDSW
ncbi:hypothetical protein HAX54_030320 [Datura stramonium]|uniref:Uncharacterized protein n=1 Tax=Datura stramonium TaxID=4076 RepID=A0ABS8V7W7_DATST|nr:hypothetical protein [Datura stramonium]MCD9643143.1 hypothetical protein [Datura stramonium]